ncbi:hypothetical protein ACFX2J_000326 [Malus domestica]
MRRSGNTICERFVMCARAPLPSSFVPPTRPPFVVPVTKRFFWYWDYRLPPSSTMLPTLTGPCSINSPGSAVALFLLKLKLTMLKQLRSSQDASRPDRSLPFSRSSQEREAVEKPDFYLGLCLVSSPITRRHNMHI